MSSEPETGPDKESPKGRRRPGWLWIATTILLIIAVAVGVLELIPENYYMLLPGDAQPVSRMIDVKGHPPVHERGGLYMVDVSVYKVNHLLEYLYGRLNPDADLEKAQTFSGGLSESQLNTVNRQLMLDSTKQAELAALSAATGFKPRLKDLGPAIVGFSSGAPASKVLKAGDIIKAVDGHPVTTYKEVAPLVRRHRPGEMVRLTIERGRRLITRAVKTIASSNGHPDPHGSTPLIGVSLQDAVVLPPLPVKIRIKFGNIGGPSAGLMFTLGIIERLRGHDLTHGCKVAGTGTIDYRGTVGAIGGVKQKIIAARNVGARYFLVPDVPENVRPARQNRGGITVVPVKTLRQTLQFLQKLPQCK